MRPIVVDIPASGESVIVPLDIYQRGPVTCSIIVLTGSPTLKVQYTMDDPFGATPPTNWVDAGAPLNAAAGDGALVDSAGHLIVPRAIKGVNSGGASTGRLIVSQPGVMG